MRVKRRSGSSLGGRYSTYKQNPSRNKGLTTLTQNNSSRKKAWNFTGMDINSLSSKKNNSLTSTGHIGNRGKTEGKFTVGLNNTENMGNNGGSTGNSEDNRSMSSVYRMNETHNNKINERKPTRKEGRKMEWEKRSTDNDYSTPNKLQSYPLTENISPLQTHSFHSSKLSAHHPLSYIPKPTQTQTQTQKQSQSQTQTQAQV